MKIAPRQRPSANGSRGWDSRRKNATALRPAPTTCLPRRPRTTRQNRTYVPAVPSLVQEGRTQTHWGRGAQAGCQGGPEQLGRTGTFVPAVPSLVQEGGRTQASAKVIDVLWCA